MYPKKVKAEQIPFRISFKIKIIVSITFILLFFQVVSRIEFGILV